MRTSWLAMYALLALAGMMISVTMEGNFLGTDETNVFYQVMHPQFATYTNPFAAVGGFFIWVIDFVRALFAIFMWDYAFLEGSFGILRTYGWAFSLSMIVAAVFAIRGTGST